MKKNPYGRYRLFLVVLCMFFLVGPCRESYAKVKISKRTLALQPGETKKLKVSGTSKKVTWSTTAKTVAKVDKKGRVAALKAGNAVIRAKIGTKVLKCKVAVVSFDRSAFTLKGAGSSKTLKVSNGKKTRWVSRNPNVATVDGKGKVTAVGGGKARIVCVSRGIKMWRYVYVPSVNKTGKRMKEGESFTFTVSGTRNKVQYSSSDANVLSVDAKTGVCKGLTHGAAYVRGKADGYTYQCYVIVRRNGDVVTPSVDIPGKTKGEQFQQRIFVGDGYRVYTVFHQTSVNGFKKNITRIDPESTATESTEETGPAADTTAVSAPEEGTTEASGEGGDTPGPDDPQPPEPVVVNYNVKKFISSHGCAACATTTILSGYLPSDQTPVNTIQNLEFDALGFKKWHDNYSKTEAKQMPISLYGIQQVLADNGIGSRYVRTYSRPAVLEQIKDHLLKGKPVVINVGAQRYDGVRTERWTKGRHTMVLLGMTDRYKVIVADSADRPETFGNMGRIKVVELSDVCGYLAKCTNSLYPCYYTNYKSCGGFLLVDPD